MEEAGFVNVTDRIVKVPLGTWPKNEKLKAWGEWFQFFALEGLEGFALRSFTDILGVRAPPFLTWRPRLRFPIC